MEILAKAKPILSKIGCFFARVGLIIFNTYLKVYGWLKKAYTSKWRWPLIVLTSILFLYAVYFIFTYSSSPHYVDKSEVWNDARYISFRVFCGLIELLIVVRGAYLLAKHRLSVRHACLLICLLGMMQILSYSFATPIYDYDSVWNQHDDYYARSTRYYMEDKGIYDCGGGHFGLIMTIFRYNVIPEVVKTSKGYDFSFSILERYQPKTFYFAAAYFMKFNSLFLKGAEGLVVFPTSMHARVTDFTNTEWALLESTRILYVAFQWLQLLFLYKILKKINLKGKGLIIAFSICALFPMWCFFGNWMNNDGMSFFFAILGIYFALSYYKKRTWFSAIMTAASIGIGMSAKLSAAIVAFFVLPLLIACFVKSIKESKGYQGKLYPWTKFVLQMLVFAIIVFPLGLGWPIYNYVRFGQPIFFFSEISRDSPLYVSGVNAFEMFFLFPNIDVFKTVWVIHGRDSIYPQDTSFLTAIIKTGLYGEYSFNHSIAQAGALYFFAIALVLFFIFAIFFYIYVEIRYRPKIDLFRLYAIAGLLVVIYGWGIFFCYNHPFVCNMDMRYVAPIIIPFAALIGVTTEKTQYLKSKQVSKWINNFVAAATIGFMGCSLLFYVTLTGWFC